jgi:hypothetical protein
MSQCTAPVRGHRSAAAAAACPACRYRTSYRSSYYSYSPPVSSYRRGGSSYGGWGIERGSVGGRAEVRVHPIWRNGLVHADGVAVDRAGRPKAAEQAVSYPERRDLFLCHAWDDRESSATELCNRLQSNGASVWFSEKDVPLGTLLIREIDKGLRNSCIGIVLVTPRAAQEHRAGGHRREGVVRAARNGPGYSCRARDDIRGASGSQSLARLQFRIKHRRLVAG